MQRQHIPMSISEYETMPKPFGYKVEYWGGEAVFTPRDCPVDCQLTIKEPMPATSIAALAPDITLQTALVNGFFIAFNDTVEFCDWREEAIWAHTEKTIAGYFSGQRGAPSSLSRIVLGASNEIQACALLVEEAAGELQLDLLFVHPDQQRQGMARALIASIINQMHQQQLTQLFSTYHICNDISQAWHEAMGFETIPEDCYAQLSYAWYRDEHHRLQRLNPGQDYTELQVKMIYWQEKAESWWRSQR